MKGKFLGAAMVGALVVAGCGGNAEVQVHSNVARQIRRVGVQCPTEYKTLATAFEAYLAMTGELAASEDALVAAQLLREDVPGFELIRDDAGDGYEFRPVGPCFGFEEDAQAGG